MAKELVEHIIGFLESIDIQVVKTNLDDDTFLPGIQLQGQCILIDETKLKYPGDLLHEAGHIAVTEAKLRPHISTDKMEADWPTQGDEIVAILWSYAAVQHLQLDPSIVFHEHGYKNASPWFIEQFSSGTYMGLPLLSWMGLCEEAEFPKMRKWLR
ncbi:hypothetical protein [Psychroserpens luteolus]|uniref:hypothetical protein n=1 Tax=Psychroserpens luteolus TaxID=2855840 RepID=UPI001E3C1177|nr:hypothetical protein [Psychroserpens luteolus]MCD2259045.1 hypothetical protein [Psychroserpens luteolus]